VHLLVRESESGLALPELVSRTGMLENEVTAAVAKAPITVIAQSQPWYVDTAWFQAARERLGRAVPAFHKTNPLLPGVSRQDLRNRELPRAPQFVLEALLASARDLVVEGETVRLRSHQVVLKEDEEKAKATIEGAFQTAGLAVPSVAEVLGKSGVEAAR